jgi:hypothetical protein
MEPDWPVLNAWTRLMQELGRAPEALNKIQKLVSAHPECAEQWKRLAARLQL